MKTLLIILVSVMLSVGASAQHRVYYHSYHPRVYIAPYSYGFGFGYPYFGYPYFGYPYYGYPIMVIHIMETGQCLINCH